MGSRGSRGLAAPRPVPQRAQPAPALAIAPPAPPERWSDASTARASALGFAAGGILGGLLCGLGHGVVGIDLLLAGGIVVLLTFIRRRRAMAPPPARAVVAVASPVETSPAAADADSSLDLGVREIRRTDPGFDPSRFAGYAAMVFRDTQRAWMTDNVGALRDRVTPEMYGELGAQCDRLRGTRQANRLERIEIAAEITEAWQESGRDYVTAYIGGSLVEYTLDEVSGGLVAGSRTSPRSVEEFWTFTRPAGLNFWMLSAIQTS